MRIDTSNVAYGVHQTGTFERTSVQSDMPSDTYKKLAEKLLNRVDVQIDGARPWDLQVHDERFYERVFRQRTLGLGESYMEGWWDCEQLDELIRRALSVRLDLALLKEAHFLSSALGATRDRILSTFINRQTKSRALEVGRRHYDLGNDLFELMLDTNLNYSCGYWKEAQSLDDAQIAKMDLVCRKLDLKPGMRILDIGCGFGSLAHFAASRYGVSVVGITISEQQRALATQRCRGLSIDIRFQDYRDVNERFDRICSIGMFEHVGVKNYGTFMNTVARCLRENGIFLLHTIGSMETVRRIDAWTDRYIFPNGMLPSIEQIGKAIEPYFVLEDWHNFGLDYAKTLHAWHHNFTNNWPKLKEKYSQSFYRMWVYYLLSSAGGFLAKTNQLWQIVLTKPTRREPYHSVR